MIQQLWQQMQVFGASLAAWLRDSVRSLTRRRVLIALAVMVLVVGCATLFVTQHRPARLIRRQPPTPTAPLTYVPPSSTIAPQLHHIGPDFGAFYDQQHGALWLGSALSPEYVDQTAIEQIFQGGVLRMTTNAVITPRDTVTDLVTRGAAIAVTDPTAAVTYATLWQSTTPTAAPWWWQPHGDPKQIGLFIVAPTAVNQTLGYYIPAPFVPYLTQLGDWQAVLGAPITQTYAAQAHRSDGIHKLVIQAFERAVLWFDQTAPGSPQVAWQQSGADYLQTFGAPQIATTGRAAWSATTPAHPLASSGSGGAVATFTTPFALTCLGDVAWQGSTLWYHVAWQNLAQRRDGWLSEDQLQFIPPANLGRQIGDLSALSPQLSAYVQSQSNDVGMAVYLPASNRLFVANSGQLMEMDSTFKVAILTTLLHETEQQGRQLTTTEDQEATVMIEQSDNTAFEELYEDAGSNGAIESYMHSIGVSSLHVNTTGIGSTLIAPQDMITLLDDLQDGHILNAADSQYVLNLMRHVVPGQRMGVGDTAPPGATYAMKDGYSPGIDFGFNMNSVGIVTDNGQTYIIAVYTRHHASQDIGTQVVNAICSDVVKALLTT